MRIGVEMVDANGRPMRKGFIEAEDVFDAILPALDRAHELMADGFIIRMSGNGQ